MVELHLRQTLEYFMPDSIIDLHDLPALSEHIEILRLCEVEGIY